MKAFKQKWYKLRNEEKNFSPWSVVHSSRLCSIFRSLLRSKKYVQGRVSAAATPQPLLWLSLVFLRKKIAQDHVQASGGDIFVRSDWRSRARSANSLGAEPPGTWSSFLSFFRGSDEASTAASSSEWWRDVACSRRSCPMQPPWCCRRQTRRKTQWATCLIFGHNFFRSS